MSKGDGMNKFPLCGLRKMLPKQKHSRDATLTSTYTKKSITKTNVMGVFMPATHENFFQGMCGASIFFYGQWSIDFILMF
jgi:hypothetical protein